MELLKNKITNCGEIIGNDIVKVDSFLNHQIDVPLLNELGKEFKRRFADCGITKILTIEASGIGIACIAAQYFDVPVVFAKKGVARNIGDEVYVSNVFSFTKNTTYNVSVSHSFLSAEDKLLIIDDFLANGNAILGLWDIINQAGAELAGVGVVIEKGFQNGGALLREKGIHLESLAIVDAIGDGGIVFR